jgi:hypothetical protein
MKDEALKLALEALEKSARNWPSDSVIEAITAIKQALSAPTVQEPVCAMCKSTHGKWSWMCGRCLLIHDKQPTAAQRQWVGLTRQDIDIAFDDTQEGGGFDDFAHAIEAKLKEKNT